MTILLLSPDPLYALTEARHRPHLSHYGRVRTLEQWLILGFRVAVSDSGLVKQAKGKNLYKFSRLWRLNSQEQEALSTGKRMVTHFFPMLDYVRAGVSVDDFVSHPGHYRDFCLASLAMERGEIDAAITGFQQALAGDPNEVRYAERYFTLRVARGDVQAPAEELVYFSNEVDSMIHSGRVYEWVKLLLANGCVADAAAALRRTAYLLEEKIAGRLPNGRYSGDDTSFVTCKRDEFRTKLDSWAAMRKYKALMTEIDSQGGLPEKTAKVADFPREMK